MVFTSPVFLFLFLPIVLLLTLTASNRKTQNTLLLLASLLFYAWGEGQFVLLMVGTALFNHACGILLEGSTSKRSVLVFAVVCNIGTLVWFKYANFFVDSINPFLLARGAVPIQLDPVHLPIGVSFFIFHSLSYVVDVYRGHAVAQRSPGRTVLYIALFPQLVAGPIIRYHDVAGQLVDRITSLPKFASGVRRFIIGLAKKVLIADLCARIADPIFDLSFTTLTPSVAWLGVIAYAVQIYFDFSGYSDMAIGLGRMFGFEFLENFRRPYAATSLRDFWKRWHISLTNFFRDYLYIPLGGNRHGPWRTYFNLVLVFLLTGLWHGASWSFVVWGMIHGAVMMVERAGLGKMLEKLPPLISRSYTLLIILITWVFFRAQDITAAWRYIQAMFGVGAGDPVAAQPAYYLTNDVALALLIGVIGGLGWYDEAVIPLAQRAKASGRLHLVEILRSIALLALFVLVVMALATRTFDPFIYFRF